VVDTVSLPSLEVVVVVHCHRVAVVVIEIQGNLEEMVVAVAGDRMDCLLVVAAETVRDIHPVVRKDFDSQRLMQSKSLMK
jgi:rhamnose utilization protein RhaD (predicted bifunctional aldolase and dehydrogenase)